MVGQRGRAPDRTAWTAGHPGQDMTKPPTAETGAGQGQKNLTSTLTIVLGFKVFKEKKGSDGLQSF